MATKSQLSIPNMKHNLKGSQSVNSDTETGLNQST